MKARWLFGLSLLFGPVAAMACGEETANVRPRLGQPEGGGDDAGLDAETSTTSCGVIVPTTYESPGFDTNALQELGLRRSFDEMLAPMRTVETQLAAGATPTAVTKAQLTVLYNANTPSVKTTSTPYYQGKVEAWFGAYETALADGTYMPGQPDAGEKGGRLSGHLFDPHGVDLLQAIEKGTITAAFYNQAVSLIALGPITTGTIDRLLAAYGAHPSFPNNDKAAQYKDVNAAAYAARRSTKDATSPGSYQKVKTALLTAKATVEAGARCDADRDAALKTFLSEWERSSFASAIHALQGVIAALSVSSPDYGVALHAYGEALGLISGWKTIPAERRIMTDAKVDDLLAKMYAAEPGTVEAFRLTTSSVEAATRLQDAIRDIKTIYGFSDAEVESFKTDN